MNNFRPALLSFFILAGVLAQPPASAGGVLNFNVSGWFTWLTSDGNCCAFDNLRHAVTGTLQYDISSGTGTITIDPFTNAGSATLFNAPITFQVVGDGAGGNGPLILGNTLFEWNNNSNLPVSFAWDATGFLNYVNAGSYANTNTVSGGALPASDNTVGAGISPIGTAPFATTIWDTTALCTPGSCIGVIPSGALPLVTDTVVDITNGDIGIGGNPMIEGPFSGFNVNLDITSLQLTTVFGQPFFTEVSALAGITFQSETNVMTAGIAWIDYDNDGNQDLFIPNETGPNRLYRNLGDPESDGIHNGFTLVTGAGIELSGEPNLGIVVGDYDADGYDDIFIANGNKSVIDPINRNTLLRNRGDIDNDGIHDGFEVTTGSMNLANELKSSLGASFGDLNADGYLDLYVGHWDGLANGGVCFGNDLYINNGSGGYTNVAVAAMADNKGCAFAVPMTDFDKDGDLDLFAINDNVGWGGGNPGLDNEMLRNDGLNSTGIPVFSEAGDIVGLGEGMTAMGVAIGDYNNDGYTDYYRSQIAAGILSTNDGTGNFTASTLADDAGTGWGTVFFDANNDGFPDLYRGNSLSGFSDPLNPATAYQANTFFLNNGDGTFSNDMADVAGLTSMNAGLGMSVADYDNDGDMDVVVHGQDGSVNLFRNDTVSNNKWLKISLVGMNSNRRGIGAKVRVTSTSLAGTLTQMQEVNAGSSHGSTDAFQILFGFPPLGSTIDTIMVEWPMGQVQTSTGVALDQSIVIKETPYFTDVTSASGITHTSTSDPNVDTGGGVAWIDVNNDGYQDLYVPNPEPGANWLYINNGDGTFSEQAISAGVDNSAFQSTGASVGDVNGDGCDDLFVTNGANFASAPFTGAQRNTLFINQFCASGTVSFTDGTVSAGLGSEIANSMVSSFGDVDKDGDLDLYVGNYLPNGNMDSSPVDCDPNHFYVNDGAGQFAESNIAAGLDNLGCTLGTVMSDFDNDGDLDIYVSNDFTTTSNGSFLVDVPDAFYRNLGATVAGVPQFERATDTLLTDAPNGMGIAVGDYDNDGDFDYYTTSFAPTNVLNINNGDGTFTDFSIAGSAEDNGGYTALNDDGSLTNVFTPIGWGIAFLDIDNDGYLDLYKGNGRVQGGFGEGIYEIQPSAIFMNNRDSTFTRVGFDNAGIFTGHDLDGETGEIFCVSHPPEAKCYDQARGLAIADYDNDGDMDVFVVSSGQTGSQAPRLFRNDTVRNSSAIKISLAGTCGNRRAIGAKVALTSTNSFGTLSQLREINSGSSHGSSNELLAHFGLPVNTSTINEIRVEWPEGHVQTLTGVPLQNTMTIELDTDSDGMWDCFETTFGLDPADPGDALLDNDNDGLNNLGEFTYGTDPNNPDTDGDGHNDGVEIAAGSDPLDPLSTPPNGDINQDGAVNMADVLLATRHVLKLMTLNSDQIRQGDLYPPNGGDGAITLSDLLLVQKLALSIP